MRRGVDASGRHALAHQVNGLAQTHPCRADEAVTSSHAGNVFAVWVFTSGVFIWDPECVFLAITILV